MNRAELRKTIIGWLDDNYHFGEAEEKVGADARSFLDHGVLDSLGFVQLVLYLEKKYGLKIERKHLNRENFDGMGKILGYVTAHPGWKGART